MSISVIYRWIPAVIWMGIIFILSHQSGSELNTYLPWAKRLFPWLESFNAGHFFTYFILACLFWWAIASHRLIASLIVVILCMLYGMSDEYHQSFVPGRSPDWLDIRNDTIGAVLAMICVRIPYIRNRAFRK